MIIKRDWNAVFWDTFFATVGKLAALSQKSGYGDTQRWVEEISKQIGIKISEGFRFRPTWKIERYKGEGQPSPFDISVFDGNLALNEGLNVITSLICGGAGTAYSNANAQTGTGTSSTAAAATDTDLTSGVWVGMDASFPTYGTSQQMAFKSTFGSGTGNQSWQEFSIRNGAAADKNLNRKVQDEGTKPAGQIWILTTTFTGS